MTLIAERMKQAGYRNTDAELHAELVKLAQKHGAERVRSVWMIVERDMFGRNGNAAAPKIVPQQSVQVGASNVYRLTKAQINRANERGVASQKMRDDIYETTVIFGRRLAGLTLFDLVDLVKSIEAAQERLARDLRLAEMIMNYCGMPTYALVSKVIPPKKLAQFIEAVNA